MIGSEKQKALGKIPCRRLYVSREAKIGPIGFG